MPHTIILDKNNNKIALHFSSHQLPQGLTFFSEDKDFLQVGSWNYQKGKKLLAHIHNKAERKIEWTQEFIFIVQGKLKAFLYDEEAQFIQEIIVNAHEGLILFRGGHGYEIMEDETKVMEVKNGPYIGVDLDRRRIEK